MSVTITRKLEIDAGHRLMGHESKCRNIHGHRYVFEVTCSAAELDNLSRVIDFGKVKEILGGWLDEHWDHAFIFQKGDPVEAFLKEHNQRCFVMGRPPTAEALAELFKGVANDLMYEHGIKVTQVKLWETPNCFAIAT